MPASTEKTAARTGVAIVGLGMAVAPHAASYLQLEDRARVVYAYSPSEARRKAFAAQYPFPLANSLEQILSDHRVDVVSLLTPPNTHLDLALRCAAAGKHVLLEKPLEVSAARCQALVDGCDRHGVALGLVLQNRFRPAAEHLKTLLQENRLGALIGASVSVRNWRTQSYYDQPGRGDKDRDGGGVLLTQGIHTLDLFLFLVGMPEEVFCYATTTPVHRMETEDMVSGSFRFSNGMLGTIEATTTAYPGFPDVINLIGEHGTAVLRGNSLTVALHNGEGIEMGHDDGAGGAGADPMAFSNDLHRAVITDFLDAVRDRRPPRASGVEALKVHRFIDALLSSAQTGRTERVAANPHTTAEGR